MQFQVPQFVDVEDTIVGPLTLRQFIYVAVAGGLSALLYFSVELWLWAILSIFFFGIAAALAFVKVNGRPIPRILLSAIQFYWKPQAYRWLPEHEAVRQATGEKKISLEEIISGFALKSVWRKVQTGSRLKKPPRELKERYEIFRKLSGERRAARRVDYR
ncbi:PrgI family protein [Candidatus Parcubacteria bacterium]|nr:MAG: PrgI family protein [Candidatus Parcubacteria bacterium]